MLATLYLSFLFYLYIYGSSELLTETVVFLWVY